MNEKYIRQQRFHGISVVRIAMEIWNIDDVGTARESIKKGEAVRT